MNVTGTINAGMAKAARCMRDGVDNCKTNAKIAEYQKKIRRLTKEIGNLALVRLENGDEMCPEIMERYVAIKEAKDAIMTLKSGKKRSTIICKECGAKTSVEMKYCGMCGSYLQDV